MWWAEVPPSSPVVGSLTSIQWSGGREPLLLNLNAVDLSSTKMRFNEASLVKSHFSRTSMDCNTGIGRVGVAVFPSPYIK